MSSSQVQSSPVNNRSSLTKFAWLSIGAAVATIILKTVAYRLTGSVGLLSDAVESLVNLAGALMALGMLTIAARPPDNIHTFGHSKAEYFASGVEGALIMIAAAAIAYAAVQRLINPLPLEQVGIGLIVSIIASTINFIVSRILMRAGKQNNSITLEADAQHLMTDVWTSVGVIAAVALVAVTGWLRLDPIIALLVAANIVWTGFNLIRRSVEGLMDVALPGKEQESIEKVMAEYRTKGVEFHALLTRQAAARRFISVHMLVPGVWTVHDAHHVAEDFEHDVIKVLGEANVVTHLEPIEDEISMNDIHIDRASQPID
jgi:cation diffusion facilitator family transporter